MYPRLNHFLLASIIFVVDVNGSPAASMPVVTAASQAALAGPMIGNPLIATTIEEANIRRAVISTSTISTHGATTSIPPLISTTTARPVPQGHVFVCTDINFTGDCINLTFHSGICQNFQAPFQDSISSWGPDNGFVCELFVNANCDGESMTGSNPGFTTVPANLDNMFNSFACFVDTLTLTVPPSTSTVTAQPTSPSPSSQGHLFVCTDDNFTGDCVNLAFTSSNCINFQPSFQDSISSLGPDPGFHCFLFLGSNCAGMGVEVQIPGFTSLPSGVDNAFNSFSCISSSTMTGHLFVCTGDDFTGECDNLNFNTGICIDFQPPFQDSISSWGPDIGFLCTLFTDSGCSGTAIAMEYPGFTTLPAEFNNTLNSFFCLVE